jgi:perosamine synthetase
MSPPAFIPVNEPLLNGNEEKYLIECIRIGWISSERPFIKQFEEQLAARMGRKLRPYQIYEMKIERLVRSGVEL